MRITPRFSYISLIEPEEAIDLYLRFWFHYYWLISFASHYYAAAIDYEPPIAITMPKPSELYFHFASISYAIS